MVTHFSFVLIGINNLTMNTQPFTLLTEAIDGENSGAYLGLFNKYLSTKIVASIVSFGLYPLLGVQCLRCYCLQES